jgi:protein-S-isoprenylcysteine O-methyltransferase Ste14
LDFLLNVIGGVVTSFAIVHFIEHSISYIWFAVFILWILASITSKRSLKAQTNGSRFLYLCVVLLGIMMIFNFDNWFATEWLQTRIIPNEVPYVLGGGILTISGILFSIWARIILGSNWSGAVTIKEDHELIRRGPYHLVRHPIYTGLLFGLLGTSFVYGFVRCLFGVLIVGLTFWIKSQTEEQFMVQQFGEQYLEYRREVRALVPYIL